MSKFVPRLTRPEAGNPYYNTVSNGGYSNAIVGQPTDAGCNVLSNCVGYAYGRFNEIGGWGKMRYLSPVNAENFPTFCQGCTTGQEPRVGAVAVWQKGTLAASDGAGHVAVVEQVNSPTSILTSESGWNSKPFWTQTRVKGADGNWGMSSAYKFVCFIYNPADCCGGTISVSVPASSPTVPKSKWNGKLTTLAVGSKGDKVKVMQALLNHHGCSCGAIDGAFGAGTKSAVIKFQKSKGLLADGVCGFDTWGELLCARL